MNAFSYIVTEGVHDVAFVGRLLSVAHGANRLRRLEDLDDSLRAWITGKFKWPRFTGKHHDIERLAVPAPAFYRLATGKVVALRNAQGLGEISRTLDVDLESFRDANAPKPEAIGVVLDSDDEPADRRFERVKEALDRSNLTAPPALGGVSAGEPRVGVFALPEPGTAGTLEDLLLTLGDAAYPELLAVARSYADHWYKKVAGDPAETDWKELRKPAGPKKATIGAMTAVLKPGKSVQVSLEDNRWVSDKTKDLRCLGPSLAFLDALLAAPPAAPLSSTSPGGAS